MPEEKGEPKKRGPKGGIKHTPGKGHVRKSLPAKKRRYARKAAKKREEEEEAMRRRWAEWEALPDEVKKLRPELKPRKPRPTDGD